MYTGLSNGGRINGGRMVVRSVSVHSPANAASGTRTDLWIQALPCLYRITPTPCIDIDFGAGPYFFYYSLCINYLLCNDFLNYYYYYYYLRFALFFVHRKMIQSDYILWRHLGWTGGFVNTSLPHAGDFSITLPSFIDRAMSPLRSAELLALPSRDRLGGWNLVPHQVRTASSIPNTLTS